MSRVTRDSTPALRAGVRLQHDPIRNQRVLLAPERVVELDETAWLIARCFDGTRSLEAIAVALAKEFNADTAQIEADVIEFADTLRQKRLLRL